MLELGCQRHQCSFLTHSADVLNHAACCSRLNGTVALLNEASVSFEVQVNAII